MVVAVNSAAWDTDARKKKRIKAKIGRRFAQMYADKDDNKQLFFLSAKDLISYPTP
jgi:hypothetical protein